MLRITIPELAVALALGMAACTQAAPSATVTTASTPEISPAASPPSTQAAPGAATSAPSSAQSSSSSIRLVVVQNESQAAYRVREQLADVALPGEAIGSTKNITGSIVLDPKGNIVPEQSKLVVDLRDLRSNEDRRDQFIQRTPLQTAQFPTAEFVPRQAPGLPVPLPTSGVASFRLVGDLTIRGVTRPATWEVAAQFTERNVAARGSTSFTFNDFEMPKPSIAVVLSVEDTIRLVLDVKLSRE
ncbi:MAG TPA: YceI family protein [Dehalococcoidia bacterium]|nr:YceI family protein [Dehalococcoidia bacterium]